MHFCVCFFCFLLFYYLLYFKSWVDSALPTQFIHSVVVDPINFFFKKREENSLFSAFFSSQGPIMHAEQRAEKYLTEEKLTEVYPEQTTIYLYYWPSSLRGSGETWEVNERKSKLRRLSLKDTLMRSITIVHVLM